MQQFIPLKSQQGSYDAEASTCLPPEGQSADPQRGDLEGRVRNALNVILVASELLRRGPATRDTLWNLAAEIDQACERILEEFQM